MTSSHANIISKVSAFAPLPAAKAQHNIPISGHLTLITSPSSLAALAQQWQRLEKKSAAPVSIFSSYAWNKAWCDNYVVAGATNEIQVVAGYSANELVFLWPLMKTRHYGITVLNWLSDPIGQYGDVLCAKGQNTAKWMSNSVQLLRRLKGIDVIRLRHVRSDSNVACYAKDNLVDAMLHEQAPYLDLTTYKSDAEYDARYTSVQRRRRKKIAKALEETGEIKFEILAPGSRNDAAMAQAILEKNAWLSDRGRVNRVMGCPKHLNFLKDLSRDTSATVGFVTSEMSAGGKPVSWEIGFRYQSRHYGYITSHLNEMTDRSPSRLHMDYSQRAAMRAGMERFDLMIPNDSHKESWSSAKVDVNDYFLPITLRGKLYGHGYLSVLRPALRATYYKLPPKALKILQPLVRK